MATAASVFPLHPQSQMAEAALGNPAQGSVTFEDVAVHFSSEEWCLLEEAEQCLYRVVMLENLELITSLDCWHGMENEEAQAEQTLSLQEASQVDISEDSLSPQKAHTCVMCSLVLRDIFHLTHYQQGTNLGQKLYRCRACGKQLYYEQLKQLFGEKCFSSNVDRALFVNSSESHLTVELSSCKEVRKDFLANSEFLYQGATFTEENSDSKSNHEAIYHYGEIHQNFGEFTEAFDNKHILIQQQKTNSKQRYVCDQCGKSFNQSYSLIYHWRLHTGEKPYKCEVCGKSFIQSSNLIQHQSVHTGIRPHECQRCGKLFSIKSNLIKHWRVHTGERPYECRKCGKTFRGSSALLQHQSVHTGERPYECSECGKFFTYYSSLIKHQKVHSGYRLYVCSECGKSFTQNSSLRKHERIHTGEKPYECTECGRCFTHSSSLTNHRKIHSR
ncbi:zinc finger protein 256 [Nannospalax galili]|uniref:zinc finger protein 256 n=1 Tax=Nannospalax galili TaxID=1026970 RepID=UPI0004ED4CF1|nr:zinc finger protein 256 [Nannospalax galili]